MSTWDPDEATDHSDGNPDTAILPYVEALNNAGVETLQSCSGHIHPDGTLSSGHLWFRPKIGKLSPESLLDSNEFERVTRMYYPEACWAIVFPGLAKSKSDLRMAMKALFYALGIEESCPNKVIG